MIKDEQIEVKCLIDYPEYYAGRIKQIESDRLKSSLLIELSAHCYLGFVAFAFIKVFSEQEQERKIGVEILTEIVNDQSTSDKLEPYLILFSAVENFGS